MIKHKQSPSFHTALRLVTCAGALGASLAHAAAPTSDRKEIRFERDIRPILAQNCLSCHGSKRQDGGLRLDVRVRAFDGGDSGKVLAPGNPEGSNLLSRLTTDDVKRRMPLGGKPLPAGQVEQIRRWIEAGAIWPEEGGGKEPYREHWSFRPIRRPTPPKVKESVQVRNPIDAFLLSKLERRELSFSPEADPITLIRRLYLDLVGLPPTATEVDAYVADRAPNAYERVVEHLLASPHFGERWGRHWLDLARFAESDGYENDRIRGDAWRYRDWVVDAVNRDLPFDQFTVEQLAGDLLPNPTPEQRIAAGLHRNTLWNSAASADKEEFRTYAVKDRTDTTASVWMGLTAGCAKCHSHKYDPISQKEYYQLYAFFNNVDEEDVSVPGGKAQSLKAVPRENYVHLRGSFLQKGSPVLPGTPEFLPPLKPRGAEADRLDLARWLVDARHPLTSRVAVNRVWQHLFGQGLVPTPDNYGLSGQRPEQIELLDWLAAWWVATAPGNPIAAKFNPAVPSGGGWSTKRLIRLIVNSSAYRQSSDGRPELADTDPDNTLLSRQNRFRVEAEIVRDLSLSVSGLLDLKLGGPSIVPPFPKGLLEQRFTNEALRLPGGEHHRRGIYIHVQRTLTHPSLAAFDVADGNQACIRRDRSITPIQALTLLNDPVFIECAQSLGTRLRQSGPDRIDRIRFGFRLCCGRLPTTEEQAVLVHLVENQHRLGASEEQTWNGVARALLNLDEFTTRE